MFQESDFTALAWFAVFGFICAGCFVLIGLPFFAWWAFHHVAISFS